MKASYWIFIIAVVVACVLMSKFVFELVVGSDLPNWAKYMILR